CAVSGEDITFGLCAFEFASVDDQRLRVCVLQVFDGLNHRLDLRLHVVRLIDREADAPVERGAGDQLVEDKEELERIDRAGDQVVVAVLAVVEVEAAEPVLSCKQRDDLLNVYAVWVMSEIDEHLRAWSEFLTEQERRTPIGNVGRVEGRLVGLVLDEQLDVLRERFDDLRERFDDPPASASQPDLAPVFG